MAETDPEPNVRQDVIERIADIKQRAESETADSFSTHALPLLLRKRNTWTVKTALNFLRAHQPVPPEDTWTEDLVEKYVAVVDYFEEHPAPACIPLFIHSFGPDQFPVYLSVGVRVLKKFPDEMVLPHLIDGLRSEQPGVKRTCIELSLEYSYPELLPILTDNLSDPNSSFRYFSAMAIAFIDDPSVLPLLQRVAETDPYPMLREDAMEWIADIKQCSAPLA